MAVLDNVLKAAAEAISRATFLVISAGAGMSADSGLPTFRGNEGFWTNYPSMRRLGLSFVECASPSHFRKDPHFGWAFYGHRYNLYKTATPHQGHQILRKWATLAKYGHFVFTSNVDGHFQKAGFDSSKVMECHGSIHYLQCLNDCRGDIWPVGEQGISVDERMFRARDPLPTCPHCSSLARPNILMFGDHGWVSSRTDQQEGRMNEAVSTAESHSDCFKTIIEIGAGKAVPTVQWFSGSQLLYENSKLIRINLDDTEAYEQGKTIYLPMKALEALKKIDELVVNQA
jgi:NAD-dependent SIR2 family protein deacetylase